MKPSKIYATILLIVVVTFPARSNAQEDRYTRTGEVIYGRKHGLALTMDVFTPTRDANGLGVIFVVSGGWFSSQRGINPGFMTELIDRGYTVFAVVHGSQPKYSRQQAADAATDHNGAPTKTLLLLLAVT